MPLQRAPFVCNRASFPWTPNLACVAQPIWGLHCAAKFLLEAHEPKAAAQNWLFGGTEAQLHGRVLRASDVLQARLEICSDILNRHARAWRVVTMRERSNIWVYALIAVIAAVSALLASLSLLHSSSASAPVRLSAPIPTAQAGIAGVRLLKAVSRVLA